MKKLFVSLICCCAGTICCNGQPESLKKGEKWTSIKKECRKDSLYVTFPTNKIDTIEDFQSELLPFGIAKAKINGKYALINVRYDSQLTPALFEEIEDAAFGLLWVKIGNLEGMINYHGNEIIPVEYDEVETKWGGKIIVEKNGKKGLFNELGKQLTKIEYDDIFNHHNNAFFFSIEKNGQYGLLGTQGKIVIPSEYKEISIENWKPEIVILAEKTNGKKGLFDKTGKRLTRVEYDDIEYIDYYNGTFGYYYRAFILIEKQNRYGLLERNGKMVIPVKYDKIEPKWGIDRIIVEKNGKQGLFNNYGKQLTKVEYGFIGQIGGGFFIVEKNDCYGVVDMNGKMVVPIEYEQNIMYSDGMIICERNTKKYYYNEKGERMNENNTNK